MDNSPLVSICIPTYNRAGMVKSALESALGQTYRNIEVLVVDNASTDNIDEIIAEYRDTRLRFIRNPRNLGLFGNFNRCIELSRGKYIHILHSDDWISPRFTEQCVKFLENHPDVAMTFTSAEIVGPEGSASLTIADKDEVYPAPEGFRQLLSRRSFIVCPSVMIRRDVYEKTGFFPLEYPFSADYYQWLRVTRAYNAGHVSGVKVFYRQGEHSESFRLQFRSPQGYLDTQKIFVQLIQDLDDERETFRNEVNQALLRFIGDCLFAGFVRAENIKGFHPSVFFGIAVTTWSLLKPRTGHQILKKAALVPALLLLGMALYIPPVRYLIGRSLQKKAAFY